MARVSKASHPAPTSWTLPLSHAAAWALVLIAAAMLLAPGAIHQAQGALGERLAGGKASVARLIVPGDAEAPAAIAARLDEALLQRGGPALETLAAPNAAAATRGLLAAEADFALVSAANAPFPDGIVGVAALTPRYIHAIVPATAAPREFRDLAGLRVGVGPAESAGAELTRAIFAYYGFTEPPIVVPTPAFGLRAAFGSGEIDAAVVFDGLHAAGLESLLESGYYRLLPLREAPALARWLPNTFADELPPALYGPDRTLPAREDGPWPTLGAHTLLVARAAAPVAAVHAALDALFAPGQSMVSGRADGPLPAPPHAAVAAYHRQGDASDRAERAEWFLFVAGAALLAAALPLLLDRRRRMAEARRLRAAQRHCRTVADYTAAIEAADTPHALSTILHDMAGAQYRAERAWLAGELDTGHMQNLYTAHATQANLAMGRIAQFHLHRLAIVAGGEAAPPIVGGLAPAPSAASDADSGEGAGWWPREDNLAHTFESWGPGDAAMLETVRVRGRESESSPTREPAREESGEEPAPPAPNETPRAELRSPAPQPREKRRGKGRRRKRHDAEAEAKAQTGEANPAPGDAAPPQRAPANKPRTDQLDLF